MKKYNINKYEILCSEEIRKGKKTYIISVSNNEDVEKQAKECDINVEDLPFWSGLFSETFTDANKANKRFIEIYNLCKANKI